MKLTDDAPHWHKLWSVRLAILAALLASLEATLPLWQGVIPDNMFAALSTAAAAGSAVARVIRQNLNNN